MTDLSAYNLRTEDLPEWMRPRRAGLDWPLLAVLALSFVVLWPLLWQSGIPDNVPAQLELQRVWAMRQSLAEGQLYPRWHADLNGGYGSPVFQYLAPLPHYWAGLHSILFQVSPQIGLRFVLGAGLVMGALGLLAFVRRRWGWQAGLLAAALYLLSPYTLLHGPYLMADAGLVLATGFFPAMLWAADRLLHTGRGRDIVLLAGLTSGLCLAENLLPWLVGALVGGWVLLNGWRGAERRYLLRTGGALLLGVAMSAFYFIPAFSEWPAVRWHPVPGTALSMPGTSQLLHPLPAWSWQAATASPQLYLGLGLLGLGLPSLLRLAQPDRDWHALYFGGLALGLGGVLALAGPETLWAGLSPHDPLTAPDLYGLLTVVLAIWGGTGGAWLLAHAPSLTRRRLWLAWGGLCLLVSGLPLVFQPVFTGHHGYGQSDLTRFAIRTGITDTLPGGVLVPATVETLPSDFHARLGSRVEAPVETTHIVFLEERSAHHRFFVTAINPQSLTIYQFYHPGWRATIDGQRRTLHATPQGLIQLNAPAGRSEVQLRFGFTPVWLPGAMISLTALAMTALIGYGLEREQAKSDPD